MDLDATEIDLSIIHELNDTGDWQTRCGLDLSYAAYSVSFDEFSINCRRCIAKRGNGWDLVELNIEEQFDET